MIRKISVTGSASPSWGWGDESGADQNQRIGSPICEALGRAGRMMSTLVKKKRSPGAVELIPAGGGKAIERAVQVITPFHGGGPVSSEGDHPQSPTRRPDAVTPLRGNAVRGQLRFWWRATHGCASRDLAELRQREDALWGNASAPGLVDLRIEQTLSCESVPTDRLGAVGTGLRYGAFAAANVTRMKGSAQVRLTIALDPSKSESVLQENARQVEDAFVAWLLFGGSGGRTRRGFGAVHAQGLPDPRDFVAGLRGTATISKVPALRSKDSVVLSSIDFPSAEEAHKFAVDALRKFRQGVGIGRNEGQQRNRPGRSRWPEADEIRRLQRKYPPQHAPTHPVNAFPRGAFGMPIVFHFMGAGEPADAQLVPGEKGGRMNSPLILRPASIGGRWHAMAARLVIPDLDLRSATLLQTRSSKTVRVHLDQADALRVLPLAEGGNPDVLAAFMTFFASLHS